MPERRRRAYAVNGRGRRWALLAFDRLGERCWPRRRLATAPTPPPRRILLVRWEGFGDLITLLPAIARARTLFPTARLTWLARPEYRDFLAATGLVDEIWCAASWRAALAAPARHFDLVLEFHGDPRWLAVGRRHARRLAGFGIRGGGFWLDAEPEFPFVLDAATRQVRLVEGAAGAEPAAPCPPRLALMPAWAEAAQPLLRQMPADFVIANPGCGRPSKRGTRSGWEQLLAHCRRHGLAVVLTGGPADAGFCRSLAAPAGALDLCGRLSWGALAGLVAAARCVVAPDTGIIHLAQALGTPTVALFGPNDPAVWGYHQAGHEILVHRLPCSFCARARCPRRPGSSASPCMQVIGAAEVAEALERALMPAAPDRAFAAPATLVGRGPWV